jgi:hypothetical protein
MISSDVLQYIHKPVDEADEAQLATVLEILKPRVNKYSQNELDEFYDKVRVFEEGGSNGYSIEQANAKIRNKHKQSGL